MNVKVHVYNNIQIATNGYIAMGQDSPPSTTAIPAIPGDVNVLAPYASDIDITLGGSVRFTNFISSSAEINAVSSSVRSQTNNSFIGERLLVAEWRHVPGRDGDPVSGAEFVFFFKYVFLFLECDKFVSSHHYHRQYRHICCVRL